ncbi:MAG: T9SS type A sorting domain-containing protein [Prolixibacteraceae bacterium]|nr:T9SS type A sorting domain-containing protein [Prolixibacteraceae bacterium]
MNFKKRNSAKRITAKGTIVQNTLLIAFLLLVIISSMQVKAQRHMEYLTRGLVAVKTNDGVFLSWRIFATDEATVTFNLYRDDVLVNEEPISGISNFVDEEGSTDNVYYLETVTDGETVQLSTPVTVWENQYLTLPLQTPDGYSPNDCSAADLDGDGVLEIIVKMEGSTRDNSQSGLTDPVYLHAYRMNGTMLWSINLGINIRGGAHYTQFMVYDLNNDGRAEVACKTAPGTTDGLGNFLSKGPAATDDDSKDYRKSNGYILSGPEYLTVFDGFTGEELSTVYYLPRRHPDTENPSGSQLKAVWGDDYGNRVDRFLASVAYFDDKPSLVMCRGYYTRTVLAAWDFNDGELENRWIFDTDDGYTSYEGQGAHSIAVGDVDNDGKDEIMYGAMAIDDNGSPMYNTKFCHGDATHLGDLIPDHPGLEFFMPSESAGWTHDGVTNPGVHVRDAATGEIVWSKPLSDGDVGRAMTADITDAYPGNEFWAANGLGVYNSNGEKISNSFPPINFAAWWDGDLLREMLDGNTVSKWGAGSLLTANGCLSNNGTKSTPAISGDILGDWREEVVFRTSDNQALRVYTTTIPTEYGIYTLLHDPQYRLALAWQNVAYNQPPHTSFFIGDGMSAPPEQNIEMASPGNASALIINSPVNGFELGLGGNLTVIVHAVGLSGTNPAIVISDGDTPLDTMFSPPYVLSIPDLDEQQYSLVASAYDRDERLIKSDPIEITVDQGFPHISLESPNDNATFLPGESIYVSVDAYDTNGNIDSVVVFFNDESVTVLTESPFSYGIENPGTGSYVLKAVAYDNDGNATESGQISFEVGVSVTLQENGEGYCGFNDISGTVDFNHAGYTGSGFCNTDNAGGAQIIWAVEFQETGSYTFEWRYAAASVRPGILLINDVEVAGVSFGNTGDWANWELTTVNAEVESGVAKVTLEAEGNDGLANIDYLKIISTQSEYPARGADCGLIDPDYAESITGVKAAYKIFPVPATSSINISFENRNEKIDLIAVYNTDSSLVKTFSDINGNRAQINLGSLQNGIYIIKIDTNMRSLTDRIVVQD